MDSVVLHVQQEVALDGESGCNWDRFWYIVDEFLQRTSDVATDAPPKADPATMKRTDVKFRQFFWNNLILEEALLLYTRGASADPAGLDDVSTDPSKASFLLFSELTPLRSSEVSYQQVLDNYKDEIRIVASEESQQLALLGYSGAATNISKQGFQVLQTITAGREFGATQAHLAKLHKIDPRSMFHFLKSLIAMKLVVKIPVTTEGQYTLLCLHTRFASLNAGYKAMNSDTGFSNAGRLVVAPEGGRQFEGLVKPDNRTVSYYNGLVKQKLTDMLGHAKNQIMTVEDLAKALDLTDMNMVQNRWFNRQIELLGKLKYIKRVNVPGFSRCVQLLRPFKINAPAAEMEAAQLNLKNVIADDAPQSGICIDLSIEHQVFRHVLEADRRGIISKEIRHKMNMLNVKLLSRILQTLCKPLPGSDESLVKRVVEFVGRERRYRYYSDAGFKASVAEDHKDYIEQTKPPAASTPAKRRARAQAPSAAPTSADTLAAVTPGNPDPSSTTIATSTSADTAATVSETGGSPSQPLDTGDATTASAPQIVASSSATPGTSAITDVDSTSASKADSTQPTDRFISVAVLKRRKVLLSVLERKRMVEFHASLVAEYQQEKARLYPNQDESSVIDRKTLYRTMDILEAEGLVKVFKVQNIPMVGGGTVTKTFCLHPSIELESEEVRKFVKESTNRHLLFGSLASRPAKKAELVDLEVESLDEMQQRLGPSFCKPQPFSLTDREFAQPLTVKEEQQLKPKAQNRGSDIDGLNIAVEYGWNRAKMMRALAFHRFLLDKLASADRTLFCYPIASNVLSTSSLFEVMSLRVFLIVVGIIQEPSEESRAYLETHRDSNEALGRLPPHMKPHVVPKNNFKKRLREVLEILDALGLVSPLVEPPGMDSRESSVSLKYATNHLVLNTQYELHVNVRAPLHPIMPENLDESLEDRKQYMLLSAQECREFWMDLQASSSAMRYFPKEKMTGRPWSDIRRDFLLNLCNKKIWAEPIRVTATQRAVLMRLVNNKVRYIPPLDDSKVEAIAVEAGLPQSHVLQFYKAIRKAWHTNPVDRRSTRLPQLTKVMKMREKDKDSHGLSTKPPLQDRPKLDEAGAARFTVGNERHKRAKRALWSDADDERLLLSYALTRCVSDAYNVKFSWFSVAHAFEGKRGREICRHRFDKLMREQALSKRMDGYRSQFTGVMADISSKFDIDHNLRNFDPSPVLAYFRPNADTPINKTMDTTPLYNDLKDIERLNVVRHMDPYSTLYVEERMHSELSLPRRLQLLNMIPATMRNIDQELDEPLTTLCEARVIQGDGTGASTLTLRDEVMGKEHIILALVKAVYCLPRHKRPRSIIRSLLEEFDSHLVFQTCELAKYKWKLLTDIKASSFRIPGQRVGRAERFTVLLNGAYPRRLTHAVSAVDEMYDAAGERTFTMDASLAELKVFMTDVAMGWLQLSMARSDGTGPAAAFEELHGQGALVHFDVKMRNSRELCRPVPLPISKRIKAFKNFESAAAQTGTETGTLTSTETVSELSEAMLDPWQKARDQTEKHFQTLLKTLSAADGRRLYESIYRSIVESGTTGMVPEDIKDTMKTQRIGCTDKEIMECLRDMERRSPAILVRVGMAHVRYVSFGWHEAWTVNYRAAVARVMGDDRRQHQIVDGAGSEVWLGPVTDPRQWVVARMWKTLEGEVEKSVFETCVHAVLSHIADRPGISKGSLLRQFHKMFLAADVDDLMEELERRGAIEVKHGIMPGPASLFSKRGVYRRCERDTIDPRKVTNYFPVGAYYSYVDMSLVVLGTDGKDAPSVEEELGSERRSEGRTAGEGEGEEEDEEEEEDDDDVDDEEVEAKEEDEDGEREEEDEEEDEEEERLIKRPRKQ
ncbi:RNA polymerase III transcription initiation factor complex subunit [Dissophora globulifera]|uniref:RNA polymerase III transcription initiation factor complex subunit n=1 Tax=Dissophora globulifera TaxID=979702 RepID=A0A9P6RGR8_9FUNG|nr:RNA polymerase III transcription initiation factor complex subunit [Dissophora globulifera]